MGDVEESSLPPGLASCLSSFSVRQQSLAKSLCSNDANQRHLFEHWSDSSIDEESKKEFMMQIEVMDNSYGPGGLLGYISRARELLDNCRKGVNPLEGWKPSVPVGEAFEIGSESYDEVESLGLKDLGECGFVLVAGGLGERLGYNGIKIELPTELATETCYIQFYIESILAYESKYSNPGCKLPLCIMTSNDTNDKTVALLEKNSWFGMDSQQITIVQQGLGVPALLDNDAKIGLDPKNPYKVLAKPHGHGDIHSLLYSNQIAKTWLESGIKWIVFIQDTNALGFIVLPLSLGVSKRLGLVMNSLATPRKAKQAVGGITKLEKESGEQRTINVEYNQLDPLLRNNGYPDGDVNDEVTGFSPFPGNCNQLLMDLKSYVETLEHSKGIMPEFVNPKYADEEKTKFKKPTRLECMMQDFPSLYDGISSNNVGFTQISSKMCFSPVKNVIQDGLKLQKVNSPPNVAATGEADQYAATRKLMRVIGCFVEDANDVSFRGIQVTPSPMIVLKPSFVCSPAEYKIKFPNPKGVIISGSSSLVVSGSGLIIESLKLDGALIIECEEGATATIQNIVVNNKGWKKVAVTDDECTDEIIRIRGYRLQRDETKKMLFKADGTCLTTTIGYDELDSTTLSSLNETNNISITQKVAQEDRIAIEMVEKVDDAQISALKAEAERIAEKRAVIERQINEELAKSEAEENLILTEKAEVERLDSEAAERKAQEEIIKRKIIEEQILINFDESDNEAKKAEEERSRANAEAKKEEEERITLKRIEIESKVAKEIAKRKAGEEKIKSTPEKTQEDEECKTESNTEESITNTTLQSQVNKVSNEKESSCNDGNGKPAVKTVSENIISNIPKEEVSGTRDTKSQKTEGQYGLVEVEDLEQKPVENVNVNNKPENQKVDDSFVTDHVKPVNKNDPSISDPCDAAGCGCCMQ